MLRSIRARRPSVAPLAGPAAVAFATIWACAPAHATATASASIGLVSWTVQDLDATDGITASFATASGYSLAAARAPSSSAAILQWAPANYANVTAADADAFGSGVARISATGAQASAELRGTSLAGYQASSAADARPFSVDYTLSAHSLVIVSVQASLAASTTRGMDALGRYESAQAWASLSQYTRDPVTGTTLTSIDSQRTAYASFVFDNAAQGYVGYSQSNPGLLQLIFANDSTEAATGRLELVVGVNLQSSLAPVPEAGRAALTAAGLLVVAGRRRRKNPQGASSEAARPR